MVDRILAKCQVENFLREEYVADKKNVLVGAWKVSKGS
jgi:hypothetical protein